MKSYKQLHQEGRCVPQYFNRICDILLLDSNPSAGRECCIGMEIVPIHVALIAEGLGPRQRPRLIWPAGQLSRYSRPIPHALFLDAFMHVYKTLTCKRKQSPLPLSSALIVMSLDLRGIACSLGFALAA
jgi:hypothetical protein